MALRANLLHGLALPPIEISGIETDTVAVGAAGTLESRDGCWRRAQ
ncbi:hypothetical protein MPLA_140146 [Mesorhizobium sp. ORS 3359]|nr:hypothetical protein MPLA_140146 [Mesorhizobium sp. ORS 3359]